MPRLFLSPPHVSAEDRRLLLEAFDSNWIAPAGPDLEAFEDEVAAMVEVPHAVALSSGTAALHLALLLNGVGAGDDVLVSTFTFIASASPIAHVGAHPVFVDSEASTWNVDPDLVESELEARARRGRLPKAVVAVDLYGQCADYGRLSDACRRFDVPLIEDAAEALGATHRGKPAGSFGDVGIFSFNGNKIITTSGGGMLVSHDAALVERARFLSTQAREPVRHYEHHEIGFNYRLSNLLAALGRGQLRSLPSRIDRRRQVNDRYRAMLASLDGIELMPVSADGEPNWWLTCITVDPERFGASRDDIATELERRDIESRPTWKPLHLQRAFEGCEAVGGRVSEAVFEQGLCLPSGSDLSDADVERVVEGVIAARRR